MISSNVGIQIEFKEKKSGVSMELFKRKKYG